MQLIFLIRSLRELKSGFLKYFSLMLLVIMSMFIIVSLIGAADTVIDNTKKNDISNNVESGQFTVFVPLTDAQEEEVRNLGCDLERMFYLDYRKDDISLIRVFRIRSQVNKIVLYQGLLPENESQIALERRYCEVNDIHVGDSFLLAGRQLTVCGIVVSGDYDAPFKEISDIAVDSSTFSTGFVSDDLYDELLRENSASKSEQYQYSYVLKKGTTEDDVRDLVSGYRIEPEQVEDEYFQQYYHRMVRKRDEMTDNINDLVEGVNDLKEGIDKLKDGSSSLTGNNWSVRNASSTFFNGMISQVSGLLNASGLTVSLNADNYASVLNNLAASLPQEAAQQVRSYKELLDKVSSFNYAINNYLYGVDKIDNGIFEYAEGIDELKEGVDKLQEKTDEIIDEYFDFSLNNLTSFVTKEGNQRIDGAANDQYINKYGAMAAGVIIVILFAYVISVFVIHSIEQQSSTIGTLYALGISKNQLMLSYTLLPVIVVTLGSVIGFAMGISPIGIPWQLADAYAYFSLPELPIVYSPWLIAYCLLMPAVTTLLVNVLVLNRKLKKEPLELMRNQQNESFVSSRLLEGLPYSLSFRIRQMLKERRSAFTVVMGMFVSFLLMFIGLDCYYMCQFINNQAAADTHYEYLYTYKYPDEKVIEGGEAMYCETLSKEGFGYSFDVTLMGIDDDNPYFQADVSDSKHELVISSAMSEKFAISINDDIILKATEDDMYYAFRVTGITDNSTGYYGFMNIDSMRKLFNREDNYYNAVASDRKLDIDPGKLYSTISREQIVHSSGVFIELMSSMIYSMIIVTTLVYVTVMYLMMKVMIDRSVYNISLFKIFGYRTSEIRKMFLSVNFIVIMLGAVVSIPVAKWIMDHLYPYLISNVACGMHLDFPKETYLILIGSVIIIYILSNLVLMIRIRRITPAEVLKNVE